MKATVDSSLCQGHGLCYMNAPGVFSDDPEGHALAIDGDVPAADEADTRQAAASCPELAILLAD